MNIKSRQITYYISRKKIKIYCFNSKIKRNAVYRKSGLSLSVPAGGQADQRRSNLPALQRKLISLFGAYCLVYFDVIRTSYSSIYIHGLIYMVFTNIWAISCISIYWRKQHLHFVADSKPARKCRMFVLFLIYLLIHIDNKNKGGYNICKLYKLVWFLKNSRYN